MLSLHAGVHDELFVVWGEKETHTPTLRALASGVKKRPIAAINTIGEHPFSMTYAELIAAINALRPTKPLCEGADARALNVWLPSSEAVGPLPSDQIYSE